MSISRHQLSDTACDLLVSEMETLGYPRSAKLVINMLDRAYIEDDVKSIEPLWKELLNMKCANS